jgi:hypothetical protein
MDFETPWSDTIWIRNTQRLLNSFAHWVGHELIERQGTPEDQSLQLYQAPRVVVGHGMQADPIFFYGNQLALDLWHIDLPTLLKMPSRKTAEPVHRDERARLLEKTQQQGFVDDYRGIRIGAHGERFLIEQAIVWNVLDESGLQCGQAATFDRWTPVK